MDFDDFECILFQKWDTNGSQNPSRNWIRKGMPLESDFYDIMVDFGPQNGTQNLLKSYLKTGPKKGLQKNGLWRRLGASWGRLGALKSMGRAESACVRSRWRSRRAHSLGFLRIILYVYP